MLKLAIIGSRSFEDYAYLCEKIADLYTNHDEIEIVSGGAKGTDSLAEKYAKENNIPTRIFLPDYAKGRAATHIRNDEIIRYADEFVVFFNGESKGTASMIKKIKKTNKKITIFAV